jgi:hypothetical protein
MTPERTRLLAEKARIEAELAKLDDPYGPAVERYCEVLGLNPAYHAQAARVGLIAAAPLIPRDAGMTDAEIEALAEAKLSEEAAHSPSARRAVIAAIRETLKRAPQVRWPGEDELREMATDISETYGPYGSAMQMARRLKANLTGEGK